MSREGSGLEGICSSYSSGFNSSGIAQSMISYSRLETECSNNKPVEYVIFSTPTKSTANQKSYQINAEYSEKKRGYLQGKGKDSYRSAAGMSKEIVFNPDMFINPAAPACRFIGKAAEIQYLIEESFQKTTGNIMPNDMTVEIISKEQMQKIKGFSEGTVGFCINRKGFGISSIMVLEGSLDRVMLTIGHEIGHALSLPLQSSIEEEAKAFAFSIAWMKAIRRHNIGNLAINILPEPANNGLHNVAFDFVSRLVGKGMEAIDVFMDLIKKKLRFEDAQLRIQ